MAQRQTVSGRRSTLAWLAIVLVLVLAIALAAFVLVIGPQQQLRQQAQATAEAHQAEVERLYAAGVAFQDAGDCRRAVESLAQVISTEPGYKDAQSRLAEVHACLQAAEATTTAQAIAVAQATAEANATATAQAIAMTQAAAQANATATAAAGTLAQAAAATATAETAAAIEAAYQRGLGYYNMERWAEAKMTFEEIFAVNPTYKDVQAKLAEVEVRLAEIRALTPTAAPVTPTPVILIFTASTTSGSRDSGWQVPGCGGSFDTDADFHRIPGLSLDVTTDKPGMLLVDFTGLGYNSAVRGLSTPPYLWTAEDQRVREATHCWEAVEAVAAGLGALWPTPRQRRSVQAVIR